LDRPVQRPKQQKPFQPIGSALLEAFLFICGDIPLRAALGLNWDIPYGKADKTIAALASSFGQSMIAGLYWLE
jgi:hypothetical protein